MYAENCIARRGLDHRNIWVVLNLDRLFCKMYSVEIFVKCFEEIHFKEISGSCSTWTAADPDQFANYDL